MAEKGLFQVGSGEVDIKELVFNYLRYWYLFVLGVMLSVTGAFLHIRYNTTPQYYVEGTILIKDDAKSRISGGISGGLESLAGGSGMGNERIMLKSKGLMYKVLSELSLNTSYFIEGRFRALEISKEDSPVSLIVSKLDSKGYGKSIKIRIMDNNNFQLIENLDDDEPLVSLHKFGSEINKSYATFTVIAASDISNTKDIIVQFHDIWKLAENYSQKLGVGSLGKETNILKLSLVDAVPQRSVNILNKLVEVYNIETVEDKNQVGAGMIDFLDERIHLLSIELTDVERNVEQYKQENALTDVSSNAQLYLQSANEYNKQLREFAVQLDIINSLEEYIKSEEPRLVPSSLNISDPTLNGLLAKFNELQLERQRMLRTIQPSSSLILNMDDQLGNLKVNIRENLKNIKNGLMITRSNLELNSSQFQSKIRQVPSIERELLEINRQQSIKQQIYVFLLQKREEAGLSLAATTANSRIIDAPTTNNFPISPNKKSIYLAAIMLGLTLPVGLIYLKEIMNDKVVSRKDVEKVTNIPILGEIMYSRDKDALQVTEGSHTAVAEMFRLIRANLRFIRMEKENKVILITSSRSGEGKTFFSINLAASLAVSGKKVIIIDFDLRKPKIMEHLRLPNDNGLANYLASDHMEIATITTSIEKVGGLHVIGSGEIPANPSELMMSGRVGQLITELRAQYDYIIIDSTPIGQVADTFNISSYADSSIYLVRYNYTFKAQLAIINDIYANEKLNNPLIVMNGAKKNNGQVNGYGYGYGYGYGVKNKKVRTPNTGSVFPSGLIEKTYFAKIKT